MVVSFCIAQLLEKNAEREVWTSIMEEFSSTVRIGVFTSFAQVKKANKKICTNRRKKTEGTVPPPRRAHMGNLDKWIDKWVRVWKLRDVKVNYANYEQSIREMVGENKLKRMFRHRMEGSELPQELDVFTLSPRLLKETRKHTRTVERSLRNRRMSLFPSEDESDSTDVDLEEEATLEATIERPPLRSIEQESQLERFHIRTPDDLTLEPNLDGESGPELPRTSPHAQNELRRCEQILTSRLKEVERRRPGEQVFVTDLVQECQDQRSSLVATSYSRSQESLGEHATQSLQRGNELKHPVSRSDALEEDHSAILPIETSIPEQASEGEANIQRRTVAASLRSQRLRAGTYVVGQSIPVGWHTRQVPLAGANTTAERDYRQTVSATVSNIGHINLRLRANNMRGEIVPAEFRLWKGSSVSYKDVIYYPRFNGMAYDEIRLDVASQSRIPVDQRVTIPWLPTPAFDSDNGNTTEPISAPMASDRPAKGKEATLASTETSMSTSLNAGRVASSAARAYSSYSFAPELETRNGKEVEIVPRIMSVAVETRKHPLPEPSEGRLFPVPTLQSQNVESNLLSQKSKRAVGSSTKATDDIRTQLNEKETRKRKRSPARPRMTYRISSPRTNSHRITPSKFYGTSSSGNQIVSKGQSLSQKQDSASQIPEHSQRPAVSPHHETRISSDKGLHVLSSFYTPPGASIPERDQSDSESLPDIEELHKRHLEAAQTVIIPSTSQQAGGQQNFGATGIEESNSHALTSLELTARDSSPRVGTLQNIPEPFEEVDINCPRLVDEIAQAQENDGTHMRGPRLKKRARHTSMAVSSGGPRGDLQSTAQRPSEIISSTRDGPPAKKRKQWPYSESVIRSSLDLPNQGPIQLPTSGLAAPLRLSEANAAPGLASILPIQVATQTQPGQTGGSSVDKGKGIATQPRDRDGRPKFTPKPPIGNENPLIWRNNKGKKGGSSHQPQYDQPSNSSQPTASRKHRSRFRAQAAHSTVLPPESYPKSASTSLKTSRNRQRSRGGRLGRRQEGGGRDQFTYGSDNNSSRSAREMTTNTVDFNSFTLDKKIDSLHREVMKVYERFRQVARTAEYLEGFD